MKRLSGLNPKTCGFVLAAGAILVHAAPAHANGRFPQSNQFVFSPTNPDLIVLRTTYGILLSHDDGATWQFLCEDAIGVPAAAAVDPPLGMTQNDSLLAGTSLGLNVSPDMGCNWKCIGGLAGQAIADLAVRPDSPSGAVAITKTYFAAGDSGQEDTLSQIFGTDDDGVTWTSLGTPIDPTFIVETVDVAKTDPNRLYVSGIRGYGADRTASLFVSKDKGTTWTELPLPASRFDPTVEDSIFIGAVDPTNADRLYLRSSAQLTGGVSRLTVVTLAADGTPTYVSPHAFDAGASFAGEMSGEMLGLAVSDDGSTIYIGSPEDGLWRASTSDLAFEKVSTIDVQCLATRGNELWACSAAVDKFVAGVSTDGGKTFTPKLPLIGTLTGPIACAPNPAGAACAQMNNASTCGPSYQMFCDSYGCQEPGVSLADSGTASDASRGGATSTSSSCALSMPGRGGAAGVGAGLAVALFALQRRRRR